MAKLYDITNWNEQSWWNTGGTRDKKIYLSPEDGDLYYFKQSFKKGQRNYIHEFWSEIIASEIGVMLSLDILIYDIAVRGEVVGCISKSMINSASEELVEGGKYLQAFDNTFNPENIKLRHQYNFELITNSLIAFKKEKHLQDLITTIVFDALIGNSDRHQENWAIINVHSILSESVTQIEKDIETGDIEKLPGFIKRLIKTIYTVKGAIRPELKHARLMLTKQTRFAPIYDSGCSFGRELDDKRVQTMLNNKEEVLKYVNKGLAEIHWDSIKITHFELVEQLIKKEGFKEYVVLALEKIIKNFDKVKVESAVFNVDNELIRSGNLNILPKERKELVVKLLNLRLDRLIEIFEKNK